MDTTTVNAVNELMGEIVTVEHGETEDGRGYTRWQAGQQMPRATNAYWSVEREPEQVSWTSEPEAH